MTQSLSRIATKFRLYMVPLGMYFKPRRMGTREAILRKYAMGALETFRKILPVKIMIPEFQTAK
jgi:hypothetical protein